MTPTEFSDFIQETAIEEIYEHLLENKLSVERAKEITKTIQQSFSSSLKIEELYAAVVSLKTTTPELKYTIQSSLQVYENTIKKS